MLFRSTFSVSATVPAHSSVPPSARAAPMASSGIGSAHEPGDLFHIFEGVEALPLSWAPPGNFCLDNCLFSKCFSSLIPFILRL